MKRAVFNILTLGAATIAEQRAKAIKDIIQLKHSLAADERALHDTWPLPKRNLLKDKTILVFKRLLEKTNYPDMDGANFMSEGVALTGQHDKPPYADYKFSPAVSTLEQLEQEAIWRRRSLMSKSFNHEHLDLLDEQSRDEVAAGFLRSFQLS